MPRTKQTLKDRIAARVARSKADVFVPADFGDLGGYDQVLRALRQLTAAKVLARLGYGVYVRLRDSSIDGSRVPTVGFGDAVRQALDKLGVPWGETDTVRDYNAGRTTQVQANAVLVVKYPFNRKLAFRNMTAKFEQARA